MHAYTAINQDAKRKSRLVLEHHPEVVEGDAQRLLAAIRAQPLELLNPWGIEKWCRAQMPPWTQGYIAGVRERVHQLMQLGDGPDGTRQWLFKLSTTLVAKCEELVIGRGESFGEGASEGDVVMRHPDDGTLLKKIGHRDIQGYLRIIGELTGVLNTKGSVKVEVNISVAERLERARLRTQGPLERILIEPVKTIDTTKEPEYDF